MERFLSCLCDNDLEVLLIDGDTTPDLLDEAWILILSEYYELKGDIEEGSESWRLSRDITRIENHLQLVEIGVRFLRTKYSESIAQSLRMLGYRFNPKVKDPEAYGDLLDGVINRCKTKSIELEQLYAELKVEISKIDNNRPTREYFEKLLLEFEEMQGTAYNMDVISVQKFVLLEGKYWAKIDQQDLHNALNEG